MSIPLEEEISYNNQTHFINNKHLNSPKCNSHLKISGNNNIIILDKYINKIIIQGNNNLIESKNKDEIFINEIYIIGDKNCLNLKLNNNKIYIYGKKNKINKKIISKRKDNIIDCIFDLQKECYDWFVKYKKYLNENQLQRIIELIRKNLFIMLCQTKYIDWKKNSKKDLDECVICLQKFKWNNKIKIFGCGEHIFHKKCLEDWMKYSISCPICRKKM